MNTFLAAVSLAALLLPPGAFAGHEGWHEQQTYGIGEFPVVGSPGAIGRDAFGNVWVHGKWSVQHGGYDGILPWPAKVDPECHDRYLSSGEERTEPCERRPATRDECVRITRERRPNTVYLSYSVRDMWYYDPDHHPYHSNPLAEVTACTPLRA